MFDLIVKEMGVIYQVPLNDFFPVKTSKTSIYYDSKKNQHKTETFDSSKAQRCWHDHHQLEEGQEGLSIPIRKNFTNPNEFQHYGKFCSFECMLSFIALETKPLFRDAQGYITQMLMDQYPDLKLDEVSPAPPFEALVEYGGTLSIKEFRKGNHKMKKSCHFIVLGQSMDIKE